MARGRWTSGVLVIAWLSGALTIAGQPQFVDVTDAMPGGIVQLGSGGGVVADLNNDGWPDIVRFGVFLNNGDGTFRDGTLASGLPDFRGAFAAADVDGDGWTDLIVGANWTNCRAALCRNQGDGSFSFDPMGSCGVTSFFSSEASITWSDIDFDGDLDFIRTSVTGGLFIAENTPAGFVSRERPIISGLGPLSFGRVAHFADFNGDRRPDVLWNSDPRLWLQAGSGEFIDATTTAGLQRISHELAVAIEDFDEDGDFDAISPGPRGSAGFYVNDGEGRFFNRNKQAGIADNGGMSTLIAIDADLDGRVDIASSRLALTIWRQAGGPGMPTVFQPIVEPNLIAGGNGALATADFDRDGDEDLLFFRNSVLRNELARESAHWLRVDLETSAEARLPPHGVGSIVRARIGDRRLTRRISGGGDYAAQSEMGAHFGLGDAQVVDELRVEWSNGDITTTTNVPANQSLLIRARDFDCAADISGNGRVDLSDLAVVLGAFGTLEGDAAFAAAADLARDGSIGLSDLAELLSRWDQTCDPPTRPARPQPMAVETPQGVVRIGEPVILRWSDSKSRPHQVVTSSGPPVERHDFEQDGNAPFVVAGWNRTDADAFSGEFSYRSVGDGATLHWTIEGPAVISFAFRVQAPAADRLTFRLDSQFVFHRVYGTTDWERIVLPLGSGVHTLSVQYDDLDPDTSLGLNGAFVDDLRVEPSWTPVPGMSVIPSMGFEADFETGQMDGRIAVSSSAWQVIGAGDEHGFVLRTPLLMPGQSERLEFLASQAGEVSFDYRSSYQPANESARVGQIFGLTQFTASMDWRSRRFDYNYEDDDCDYGCPTRFPILLENRTDQPLTVDFDNIRYAPNPRDPEFAFGSEISSVEWTPTVAMPDCRVRVRALHDDGGWGPWIESEPFEVTP